MQFGTMHAPADVQGYINHATGEALDGFASSYLGDVLIYCHPKEEQVGHVMWNIPCILEGGLYFKPEK
jgi:hypothetical protein